MGQMPQIARHQQARAPSMNSPAMGHSSPALTRKVAAATQHPNRPAAGLALEVQQGRPQVHDQPVPLRQLQGHEGISQLPEGKLAVPVARVVEVMERLDRQLVGVQARKHRGPDVIVGLGPCGSGAYDEGMRCLIVLVP
jgi:hypothetical protein